VQRALLLIQLQEANVTLTPADVLPEEVTTIAIIRQEQERRQSELQQKTDGRP